MNNLTRTYIIALSIIALVIGVSQFLVQDSIRTGSSDSRVINISGRQRMLSQKITKAALAMGNATNQAEFGIRKEELDAAYKLWSQSHSALQYGSEAMQMPEVNNSAGILRLFGEIQPYYDAMSRAVTNILALDSLEQTNDLAFKGDLQAILNNEGRFLKLMNDITFEYDEESTGRVKALSTTEYILFAVALLLLVAEALVIFRPAINKISQYTYELEVQGESLKKALRQEEYLNNQAKAIFHNVKQGVFLLDEQLMISELYSKETERIFQQENLSELNFLKLMRPRLVKRDVDALEMFVEHLFNPDIKERVVNKLNPVERVEIYSEKSADENLDPRFINVSFSRIMDGTNIHRILVTMLDETETVKMKKQIEESEERNRIESERMLAILKVDPAVLKDFLDSAKDSLTSISVNYENDKGLDFKALINYTFNVIHNVKGNASLINLESIETKLHKIENVIVELRRRSVIEGKDLLQVVYQVAEVISIIDNMQDMQLRIAQVYEQMSSAGAGFQENSNAKIIETLEKGLDKIATAKSKKAILHVENEDTILPEQYKLVVKDIAIQLIRNSVTHGIETPEERKEIGKPENAAIVLRMKVENDGSVLIGYEDDGRGVDVKKVLSKALSLKLIKREDIASMKLSDVAELITKDGFSTALSTDYFAGRGQGMSLVKTLVEKYHGVLNITFKKGKFFKVQIKLPKIGTTTV